MTDDGLQTYKKNEKINVFMFKHKSIYAKCRYTVFVYLCIIKVYISYEEFTPSVRVDTQISSANHWSEYFSSVDMTPPLIVYQLMTPVKGIFPGRLLLWWRSLHSRWLFAAFMKSLIYYFKCCNFVSCCLFM